MSVFKRSLIGLKSDSSLSETVCHTKVKKRSLSSYLPIAGEGCPRGVMVKARDSRIVVSDFVFQLRYYVHFRANTLGKGTNPLILEAMG